MNIEKDVSDVLVHGTTNLTTVNTPVQITATTAKPKKGLQLKAAIGNTGVVYVGGSQGVNGTVTDPLCGYPLDGGESVFIRCEDPTTVRAFNDTVNDAIHWILT